VAWQSRHDVGDRPLRAGSQEPCRDVDDAGHPGESHD
jgi:hypothetical protein